MSDTTTGQAPGYEEGLLVAEFEKNTRELVRVRLTEYKGIPLVDVRTFYEDKDGARKPGKGLCLRRELLPELRKALQAAEKATREAAL